MSQDACNPAEFVFVCPLIQGLHARPASQLAEVAGRFPSDSYVVNQRNGVSANLKSTLGILAADIRHGDECSVRVLGTEVGAAERALREFILRELPAKDEAPPEPSRRDPEAKLPRALNVPGVTYMAGIGASPGIGIGKAVIAKQLPLPVDISFASAATKQEGRNLARAQADVRDHLQGMLIRAGSSAERDVLKAHLSLLDDVAFSDKLRECMGRGRTAGQAIVECSDFFATLLANSESSYVRERAIDIKDVCARLLEALYDTKTGAPPAELDEASVLIAESLSPQQLLAVDRRQLRGLVLADAGTSSHVVILARSLGIPTVVGVRDASVLDNAGEHLIVDGNRGLVVPNGIPAVSRFYAREAETQKRRRERLAQVSSVAAVTADGVRLEVAANVGCLEEVQTAFSQGAESIGLFRTEMLFLGRDEPPTEEEQFEIYKQAASAGNGRALLIRTIDIGADKPAPYLSLPREANPNLGYRGVRIYPEHKGLLQTQLRAILRASAHGRLQIMAPMVTAVDEVRWFKSRIAEAQDSLAAAKQPFDRAIPVGVMIEVPAAAFSIDQLCEEVSFFSIGTNDLSQYFMAADRGNTRVATLADVRQPAFLRFLQQIVERVHRQRKWIGMCGEMAGDSRNLPILVGLGLDEISAAAPQLPTLKHGIGQLAARDCVELLGRMLTCSSAEEVERLLKTGPDAEVPQALLGAELVTTDSDSSNKEEAIRELVDALYISGRTDRPDELEHAVWDRERAGSTSVGYGFAIPHGRSAAVKSNSVALLKLRTPVAWGHGNDELVSTVILLAVRDCDIGNSHMQVLAKLARNLMNERFRDGLAQRNTQEQIAAYLTTELAVS